MKDTTGVAVVSSDQHKRLVNDALPKAINVLIETMDLDPFDMKKIGETDDGTPITEREFSARKNSQRLRAALGVVVIVERLGDQALRRQAGAQMKKLLAAIKSAKIAKAPKTIPGESRDLPPVEVQSPSEAP